MPYNRRAFIRNSGLLSGLIGLNFPLHQFKESLPDPDSDRLVLLGTQGGPLIRSYAQTPSANLIVYQKQRIIIDTGFGVTFKLLDAGVSLSSINYIFITHHHSDHNLELGPLLYNSWIAGLKEKIFVYGPPGLKHLLEYYWESNRFDIETRIKDEGRPDIRQLVIANEYAEGIVMTGLNFSVSALKNIHPPISESYALKFQLNDNAVVFSGDTAYCHPLTQFAANAKYLVHEVMHGPGVEEMVKRRPNAPKLRASILSHHTLAEDVGKIATAAKVKNLVLNHFVPADDKSLTKEVWLNAVRATFAGNIIVGKDLLELPL